MTGFYQFIFSAKTWLVAQSARELSEKGQLMLEVVILSTANFVNEGLVSIAEQISVIGFKDKDIIMHFIANFSRCI